MPATPHHSHARTDVDDALLARRFCPRLCVHPPRFAALPLAVLLVMRHVMWLMRASNQRTNHRTEQSWLEIILPLTSGIQAKHKHLLSMQSSNSLGNPPFLTSNSTIIRVAPSCFGTAPTSALLTQTRARTIHGRPLERRPPCDPHTPTSETAPKAGCCMRLP